MRDGELSPSTLRRPQAPGTGAPRNRVALSVALSLSVLAAPLLLLKATSSAALSRSSIRTVAHHRAAPDPATSSTGSGYGVPDGILTAADLSAAAADGVTATGATGATAANAGPDSSPGGSAGPAQAHIASVSPASPVTEPQSTEPQSTESTSPPTTAAPTTTTRPPPPTTTTRPPTTTTRPPSSSSSSNSETGSASWYDAPAGTCAHPSLPFGTVVTVENLANGATTTCRVEDRGPYQGGRIIDLSEATFSQIASTSDGVIQVRISW